MNCQKCGYPDVRNENGSITNYKGIYDIRKPCPHCGVKFTHDGMGDLIDKLIEQHRSTEDGRLRLARGASALLMGYIKDKDARDERTLLQVIKVLDILSVTFEKTAN